MPCYDERNDPRWQAEEERKQFGDTKLNITTRLACDFLNEIEARGEQVPTWASRWWVHHKQIDAGRRT